MYEIILVRHGQSVANKKGLYGCDYPLSFKGEIQAVEARKIYRPLKPDKVYTSTLKRAVQTGTILFTKPVPEKMRLPEFDEINFGTAEGKTYIPETKGYENDYLDDFVAFMKECEGDNPYERAETAIEKIQEMTDDMLKNPGKYPEKTILIVTSDTIMRCIALTVMREHDWRKITDMPQFDNLHGLRLAFKPDDTGEKNKLMYMEKLPGEHPRALWIVI